MSGGMKRATRAILLMAVLSALATVSAASSPPNLKYKYVSEANSYLGEVFDLTDEGKLLGFRITGQGKKASFLWDPVTKRSSYFSLPYKGEVRGTNARGDLLGVTDTGKDLSLPLFKAKGKPWRILQLTGIRSKDDASGFTNIFDISSNGKIVGEWNSYTASTSYSFISDTKALKNTILKFPKASGRSVTLPTGVNAAGIVVGLAINAGANADTQKGFLYNFKGQKKYQLLSRKGYPPTSPQGISDAGVVAGAYTTSGGTYVSAFLHPLGTNIWTTIPKAKGKKIVGIRYISANGKYLIALDKDFIQHLYKRV